MTKRTGRQVAKQKQGQVQTQIQLTEQRRDGMDALDAWDEMPLPGPGQSSNSDLGYDDQLDGDAQQLEDEEDPGTSPDDLLAPDDAEPEATKAVTLSELLGSRRPAILLRLDCPGEEVRVRLCSAPVSAEAREALTLLTSFVARCFDKGRSGLNDLEWDELMGRASATLTRRLTLLLRLAVKANEKVSLGEETGAAFTPHDVGLERFASKFAALPDGTPFSLRLLLLDQRGRERGEGFFDQLPDAVKLLALRKTLDRERKTGVAVSDNDFRSEIQTELESLLGTPVPKPTEDQIRRRLRDNFKRRGLETVFPNQRERQREYDQSPHAEEERI